MSNQGNGLVEIVLVPELGCSTEFPVPMMIDEHLLRIIQVAVQEQIDVGITAVPTL